MYRIQLGAMGQTDGQTDRRLAALFNAALATGGQIKSTRKGFSLLLLKTSVVNANGGNRKWLVADGGNWRATDFWRYRFCKRLRLSVATKTDYIGKRAVEETKASQSWTWDGSIHTGWVGFSGVTSHRQPRRGSKR